VASYVTRPGEFPADILTVGCMPGNGCVDFYGFFGEEKARKLVEKNAQIFD